MAAVWGGCSTSRGSFSLELPRRGTAILPRNAGRSGGEAHRVSGAMVMARGVCVCRAAAPPCVTESDVTRKEEEALPGARGMDDERPVAGGFVYHKSHGLRRRPVKPPAAAVEKEPVRARSVRPVPVSESAPEVPDSDKFEHEGSSRLHFLEERDEEKLSTRLMRLGQSNKVRSAMELFDSMRASGLQPTAHACNSLLASLIRRGYPADARKMFEFMKEKRLATGHTYTLMLKAVARTEGYISALQMFSEIEEGKESREALDVIVYNTMISACGRAKEWRQVEKLWRRLAENNSLTGGTLMTYDLLVSTFVQCGQSELAVAAYEEMLRNGLDPSEDIMKAVVASCTREGRWEFALATFRRMLSAGMKPNIIAFNSIINSLGKAGEDELAFRMYHLLISSGLEPDQYTWSALLSALHRSGRCWDALDLFHGIKSKHPSVLNSHLYHIALMSCERLGQWEHALQLLWMMEKHGLQISAVSYNHVIRACEVACEPKVALKVYQRMTRERCSPDTFTHLSVIRACIWGSLWDEVEGILEEVEPDSSIYNTVIHGLCLRGKPILARKVYKKMQSIGLTPDGKTRSFMLQHITSAV
ncbi:pentatricopeptide repeat-containing protein At3g29290-like isoform X2 [Lolium rigidum]|uniref:pentatricopeptide repeat-containing protein At3g29290-like isoform X2 n=1 Tax=Lolium rigidum TaxID=89674 RepID=UPI001F5DB81F|nr:pentatricopeptide repeat-containing protein At3g29290-like isoform X2 [Lolium rigidum]